MNYGKGIITGKDKNDCEKKVGKNRWKRIEKKMKQEMQGRIKNRNQK